MPTLVAWEGGLSRAKVTMKFAARIQALTVELWPARQDGPEKLHGKIFGIGIEEEYSKET